MQLSFHARLLLLAHGLLPATPQNSPSAQTDAPSQDQRARNYASLAKVTSRRINYRLFMPQLTRPN